MQKIDLPTFIAGLVSGFIALSNEPWWTLVTPTNGNILSIQVSPFYIQISAIGVPPTIPTAALLGAVTRVLLIICSLALVASSLRPTAWWRGLVTWLSLACLMEVFFSLLLFIHVGQTALLTIYGTNPPITGTVTYPAKIIGTDLNTYSNPIISGGFSVDFYLGLLSLTIVGAGRIIKTIQEQSFLGATLPGVRELVLTPPYRHVWLSTNDRGLNPLSQDPENTSDEQLLESFRKIYDTVQPGGTISIILPNWAKTIADRFQKLLAWTGFSIQEDETIHRTEGKPETQIRFKKPLNSQELANQPTESAPSLQVATITEPSPPDSPPEPVVSPTPGWMPAKMSRQERAMLRSAVSILARANGAVPYRELLNQVYMDLIEKKVQFESAREIETALLKHTGQELYLVEEPSAGGNKPIKEWTLGEDPISEDHDRNPILRRVSGHHPRIPSVARLLKKWQRKPRYQPKPEVEE